jgi:hypothetical protein
VQGGWATMTCFYFGGIVKTTDLKKIEELKAHIAALPDVELIYSSINTKGFWLSGHGWSGKHDVHEEV